MSSKLSDTPVGSSKVTCRVEPTATQLSNTNALMHVCWPAAVSAQH
jgi:hypothetical protein